MGEINPVKKREPVSVVLVGLYLILSVVSIPFDPSLQVFRVLASLFFFYWLIRLVLRIFSLERYTWWAMNLVVVGGVGFGVYILRTMQPVEDPNDPNEVGVMQPTVIRRNLKRASDAANFRVDKGELTEAEAKAKVTEHAESILETLKLEKIPDDELWEYGEVLWTAEEWDEATPVLEKAVKVAKTEDRRINDSLRLAKCYAALNQVDKALETARSTLNAEPKDRAPILLAITLEIAPKSRGKGKDEALAQLIEDAIEVWDGTEVDQNTEAGQKFVITKRKHIRDAWQLVADLRRKDP